MDQVLETLATSGPMALVLGGALYVVWNKYQAALVAKDAAVEAAASQMRELMRDYLEFVQGLGARD